MNPVSNTAFYCCGIRMDDANRRHSICNDTFAARFMETRGLEIYAPFRSETMPNLSNISRCRIIDDYVSAELQKNASTTVITIGAGFDTRPYRLPGGEWIELDEPQVIEYKNNRLSADECDNPLKRISIDFANESLSQKLSALETRQNIVIVIEGVFMYLEQEVIENTIQQIQQRFPRHTLLCDLMSKRFFDKFAQKIHSKLVAAGGMFADHPQKPADIFDRNNYQSIATTPMFKRAGELGLLWDEVKIPAFLTGLLLNVFMKDLQGYAVHRFHFGM